MSCFHSTSHIAKWEICGDGYGIHWEEIDEDLSTIGYLLQRVHREATSSIESEQSALLFDELISYPGISDLWNISSQSMHNDLILTTHLKKNDLNLRFFATIATLGTPYDITLQEIRIECLFPADEVTENNWSLAEYPSS